MQATVAAKKIDGKWEAALINEGRFGRSFVGKSIAEIVTKAISPMLAVDLADGAEIAVNVAILTAEDIAAQETIKEKVDAKQPAE